MKRASAVAGTLAALMLLVSAVSARAGEVTFSRIEFQDLMEGKPLSPRESWNSVGIDEFDNIYAVFGGPTTEPHGEDCVVIQYNTQTGERRVLGIVTDAMKEADNYREDEHLPKGHSHLIYMNGRVFFGVQGFHDALGNPGDRRMIEAENARGAHLFAYDIDADKIVDLSASQEDGVFFPSAGFLNLAKVDDRILVVQTIPQGHMMLYDTLTDEVKAKIPGIEAELGRYVSREIAPAPNGKIYFSYATAGLENLHNYDGTNHVYWYDTKTGETSEEPCYKMNDPALWAGRAVSKDGTQTYFVQQHRGNLWKLDYENDRLELIGNLIPEDERETTVVDGYAYGPAEFFGLVMSKDEKSLYGVTVRRRRPATEASEGMRTADGTIDDAPSTATAGRRGGRRGMRAQGDDPATMPARGRQGARGGGGGGDMTAGYSSGNVMFGLAQFDIATGETRRVARVPEGLNRGYALGSRLCDSDGSIFFETHTMRAGAPFGFLRVDFEDQE